MAAAKDGDVIQLASDITITSEEECVTFAKDADVTLDLNGYTIKKTSFPNNPSYKEQKGCINVSIGALTIKDGDGASDKEGGIIAGVTGYAYAIDVNGSGEVIIADDLNIKFEGGSAGALVKLRNNGKFTLIEGTLDAHSCTTSTSTEVFELYDTGADSAVNIEGGLVLCNQGAGFSWGSKPKWNITGGTFNKYGNCADSRIRTC